MHRPQTAPGLWRRESPSVASCRHNTTRGTKPLSEMARPLAHGSPTHSGFTPHTRTQPMARASQSGIWSAMARMRLIMPRLGPGAVLSPRLPLFLSGESSLASDRPSAPCPPVATSPLAIVPAREGRSVEGSTIEAAMDMRVVRTPPPGRMRPRSCIRRSSRKRRSEALAPGTTFEFCGWKRAALQ